MLKTRIIQNEPTGAGRSPSIIEVDGLTKDYGSVRAVDRLSFSVTAGTITGFLGANGSGKTTTPRSLLGLVAPTEGSCRIDGRQYRDLRRPLNIVGSMLEADPSGPERQEPPGDARGRSRHPALEGWLATGTGRARRRC